MSAPRKVGSKLWRTDSADDGGAEGEEPAADAQPAAGAAARGARARHARGMRSEAERCLLRAWALTAAAWDANHMRLGTPKPRGWAALLMHGARPEAGAA